MKIMPISMPNDMDEYFYNRVNDINKLNSYIAMLKNNVPNQILITGYRGIGKTVLLKKVLKDQGDDILTVFLDLSEIFGVDKGKLTEEEVIKELLSEINKTIRLNDRIYSVVIKKIKEWVNKLKLKNYKFDNESIDIFNIPLPKIKDNYAELSRFTLDLPQKIVDSTDKLKGFVIAFDEFQLLKYLDNPNAFFWLIRSFSQKQDNVSYIFTGSASKTADIIEMINGQNGAFGGRMIQINIDPFTRNDTKNYVLEKSDGISFTKDGFDTFYHYTRGIPTYINCLCSILPSNYECDSEIINENIRLKIDQVAVMWIYAWGSLNHSEKEIVKFLSKYDKMTWKQLNDNLNLSKATISKYIDSLMNNGIVEYNIDGEYYLTDEMLKTWLELKSKRGSIISI